MTFRALTHEKVAVDLFDDPSDPIHHISLAQECDVFLIAPCTANVMAKVACGIADDLLSRRPWRPRRRWPSRRRPTCICTRRRPPGEHGQSLRRRGVRFIEGAGYLACGDVGSRSFGRSRCHRARTLALLAERVGLDALREACERHGEVPFATVMEQIDAARASASASSTEDAAASASARAIPSRAPKAQVEGSPNCCRSRHPLPAAVADGAATMPAGALAGRTVLVTAGPRWNPSTRCATFLITPRARWAMPSPRPLRLPARGGARVGPGGPRRT